MEKSGKIIVTGGAGFIGSHIVRRLVQSGHEVAVLVKPDTDIWRLHDILSSITRIDVDISDVGMVQKNFETIRPSGVFHLAAANIMSGKTAADEEVIRTNIIGTKNLIDAARAIGCNFFINTGTFLEYGLKNEPLKETDRCDPTELYSITKLAGTLYGQSCARRHGMPVVTFRLFTPYGPYIQEGRLIEVLVSNALQHKELRLSAPEITRGFVFVEDIVDLYIEAAEKAQTLKGEVFNLGSGQSATLERLVECVLEITHSKSPVTWGAFPITDYDKGVWCADMTKTFSAFSWRPKHDLADGIAKTVAWFKKGVPNSVE